MSRANDFYVLCTMPEPTFKEVQGLQGVYGIDVYDRAYFKHYKENEQWQIADANYKDALEIKKSIEYAIRKNLK